MGQPDTTHTTVADWPFQRVRPDAPPRQAGSGRGHGSGDVSAKEVTFIQSRELCQPGANRGRRGRQARFELIQPTLASFAIQIEGFIEVWTDLAPDVLERSVQGCDSG